MTEEEAKTKWCPFARAGGPMGSEAQGTSYNRWPSSDGTTKAMLEESGHIKCISSACMAWRRRRWFWWPAWTVGEQMRRAKIGRCGLAGKP